MVCFSIAGAGLHDVAPLVDPVEIFEVGIEGTPAVDFIVWDLAHQDALSVRLGRVCALLRHILPAEPVHFEELVLFDLLAVARA